MEASGHPTWLSSPGHIAGVTGREQKMTLEGIDGVEDIGRVRRDQNLHPREEPADRTKHHRMPLRIQMQFRLINEENARVELGTQERSEERKQFQLPRTERIEWEPFAGRTDEKDIKSRIRVIANRIHAEGLLAPDGMFSIRRSVA